MTLFLEQNRTEIFVDSVEQPPIRLGVLEELTFMAGQLQNLFKNYI